uniref:Uncharacterized protein n=1 Tax=Arundo donax TaxID=35708 RepID=A0A0A9HPF3_ARUDO
MRSISKYHREGLKCWEMNRCFPLTACKITYLPLLLFCSLL